MEPESVTEFPVAPAEPARRVSFGLPALLFILTVLLLPPFAGANEDPIGQVRPLVKAEGDGFRLFYLDNTPEEPPGPVVTPLQPERRILYSRPYSASGQPLGPARREEPLVVPEVTSRFYGRATEIRGLGTGPAFVRTDGAHWYLLSQTPGAVPALLRVPWFERREFEVPWGSFRTPWATPDMAVRLEFGCAAEFADGFYLLDFSLSARHLVIVAPSRRAEPAGITPAGRALWLYSYAFRTNRTLGEPTVVRLSASPGLAAPVCARQGERDFLVMYSCPDTGGGVEPVPHKAVIVLARWNPDAGSLEQAVIEQETDAATAMSFASVGDNCLFAYHRADGQMRGSIVVRRVDLAALPWE